MTWVMVHKTLFSDKLNSYIETHVQDKRFKVHRQSC